MLTKAALEATNMLDTFENYSFLWEDETGRYVLIQVIPDSDRYETCVVYDMESKTGLIIEDDEIALLVKKRLAQSGVPILDKIPP
jgi:hypothetical protein